MKQLHLNIILIVVQLTITVLLLLLPMYGIPKFIYLGLIDLGQLVQ